MAGEQGRRGETKLMAFERRFIPGQGMPSQEGTGASQSGLMGMELPQGWGLTQRHSCSPCARGAERTETAAGKEEAEGKGRRKSRRKGWSRVGRGRQAGAARRRQPVFINFLLGCAQCHSSEIMEPLHTLLNNSICEESKCVSEHSYAS